MENNNIKITTGWFNKLISEQSKLRRNIKYTEQLIGNLLFMVYDDPKTKDELKYYDIYPLVFPLSIGNRMMTGINVHYLDPASRFSLINQFYSDISFRHNRSRSLGSFDLNPDAIKNVRLAKPCIKQYYISRIKNLMIVPYREWNNILYLPLHSFQKASTSEVWNDSQRISR